MASEVGQAYVSIIPSAKGFASKLQRELGTDLARAGKSGGQEFGKQFAKDATAAGKAADVGAAATTGLRDAGRDGGRDFGKAFAKEAEGQADDAAEGIGDKMKSGLATAGVAAGAALVLGVGSSLERSALDAKLTAQLGGGPRTKRATKVAADLFQGAWGESVEDVNNAVASVVTNIKGMRGASERDLRGVTASVLDIATAFDQDATAITRATDQLIRTDMAKGPREALDIITRGFQSGANEADDLLDTYSEYSTQFRKLGLDGKEATGLLAQGLQAGARDADIVADALKEFSIRSVEALTEVDSKGRPQVTELGQAFETLGFDVIDAKGNLSDAGFALQEDLAAGGDRAREALEKITDRLRGIKDPLTRSKTAVALFGTQAEDTGDALYALDPSSAVDALGKVGGAAKRMGDDLNDNAATRVEEFKRTLQTDFTNFIGNQVIPVADDLYKAWKDLPGPLKTVSKWLGGIAAIGAGGAFLGAKFISAIGSARDAFGGMGRKTRDAATGVTNVGDAATKSRGKLRGLTGFLGTGGAWGLALGIGVTALAGFMEMQRRAEQEVKDHTEALNRQTGAITRNNAQMLITKAREEGVFESAERLGISIETVTRALLGDERAIRRINRITDEAAGTTGDFASAWAAGQQEAAGFIDQNTKDARNLAGAIAGGNKVIRDAQDAWRVNKTAMEVANGVLRTNTQETKDNKQAQQSLGQQLGLNRERSRELAGAIADEEKKSRAAGRGADLHRKQLRDVADQMDLTREQTRQLIAKYGDVPPKVETDAKFNRGQAERDTSAWVKFFNGALGDIENEEVNVTLASSARSALSAFSGLATGGLSLLGNTKGNATGGAIKGPGTGTSDSILARLSNGEHVFTADDVRKAGGQDAMYAIRRMIQRGEFAKKGDLQYFRTGGAVSVDPRLRQVGTDRAVSGIERLFGSVASAIGSAMSESLSDRIAQALATGGGRPLGPGGTLSVGQMAQGQAFAKSQAGMPYQWGGIGNPSWDCSGFVGGVWAKALGKSPYHRYFTTAGFGSGPAGWSSGPGKFTVGNDPGSHMAGNIGGLGIESRGGDGVVLGSGITPLSSFDYMAHYDRGGELRPGWTAAYNGTGRTEVIRTAEQDRAGSNGPLRFVLDLGGNRVLTGFIRDEIEGHANFEATTARMRR